MKKSISAFLVMTTLLFVHNASVAATESTDSPYRQAGNLLFISTQVPINPLTHQVVSDDVSEQVKQVLENLKAQIIAAGATMNDVVKMNIYMDDIDLIFPIVKEFIPQYFNAPYPARSPIGGVSFGQSSGFRVAIDAIVYENQPLKIRKQSNEE